MYKLDVIGDIFDVRQTHRHKVVVLALIEEVLCKRQPYALGYAAVLLSIDDKLVVDNADITNKNKFFTMSFACFHIY